MPQGTPDYPNP